MDMRTNIYRICGLLVLFLLFPAVSRADGVTFTASMAEKVEAGDQFRLTFTVASPKELTDTDLTGFSVTLPESLDVLVGPNRAKVSQSQYIGGKTVTSYQVAYTYILSAPQAGTFTIPAANITFKGETLRSQPVTLAVVPAGQLSSGNAPQPRPDAFITMTVSERSPRVNTPVVLECKLYTAADVDSLANMEQYISSGDFKAEPIDLRGSQWQIERRDGKNYRTAVFRKLLLYPLRTGELRIGDLHMDAYIRKIDKAIDPFDAFFNDGNAVSVKKRLHCTGITLRVHE